MALGRVCNLKVGTEGEKGILISGLDIEFDIERSRTISENTAQFTVYNANEQTRNEMLVEGNDIIFEAGYLDEDVGLIFAGNIFKSISYKVDSTWKTDIIAVSKFTKKVDTEPNITLNFTQGSFAKKPIQALANHLGLVLHGAKNTEFEMDAGILYIGTVSGAIRRIRNILRINNAELYVDNSEMVIYKIGEASKFSVVYLNYKSSLISLEEIVEKEDKENKTKKRRKNTLLKKKKSYNFKSIMISQLQLNQTVKVKNEQIDSVLITDKLRFYGDSFGGDFNVEGIISAW